MSKIINVHEAKTHLSKILERVNEGEEIILAKAGKPYAKLVPVGARGPRTPGIAKGTVGREFFKPLPEEELSQWET